MIYKEIKLAYNFSIKGTYGLLTLILSVISVLKVLLDLISLKVIIVITNLIRVYKLLFHTCFDVFFFWIPYKIPDLAKDLFILYCLFGVLFIKVKYLKILHDYRHPWIILYNYRKSKLLFWSKSIISLIVLFVLWPIYIWDLIRKPFLIVFRGAHGPSALQFDATKPEDKMRYTYYGDGRMMMLLRLGMIIISVLVILVFNYAFSTL